MLDAEHCQRMADECTRRASEADDPLVVRRYRYLRQSWLYLVRMKTKARAQKEAIDARRLVH